MQMSSLGAQNSISSRSRICGDHSGLQTPLNSSSTAPTGWAKPTQCCTSSTSFARGRTSPAEVVFVRLPDINSKSTFQVAHAALLDALGMERTRGWVTQFQAHHGQASADMIQDLVQSADIAKAFANLLSLGDGGRIAWDWLRGEQLTASDARLVALPPRLDQSNQLVRVLEMVGRLCRFSEDKILVLMVDEAAKTLPRNQWRFHESLDERFENSRERPNAGYRICDLRIVGGDR